MNVIEDYMVSEKRGKKINLYKGTDQQEKSNSRQQ